MPTPQLNARHATPALVLALALLGALTWGGWQMWSWVRLAPGAPMPTQALSAKPAARSNDMRPVGATAPAPGPGWSELNTPQKLALYPLAPRWAMLSELQKRRWLALAQTFASLPPAEQDRLHERMTEWAELSAQQRSQARLNYAKTNQLAPDNKREQWDAYQALSAEEKKRLAAAAARRSMGAATAVRPVSPRKLVTVPAATQRSNNPANPPKIPATAEGAGRPSSGARTEVEPKPPAPAPAVETAPVPAPTAVPLPLPPLPSPAASALEAADPTSADTASQYSH